MLNLNQKTLKRKVKFVGVGLHTGKKVNLVLVPASPNHGIVFKRTDLKMNNQIDANFENVKEATPLCTTIQNEFGVSVSTTEHLLGALCGEEIDNLLIEIDANELPIMDGSAKNFVKKIREAAPNTHLMSAAPERSFSNSSEAVKAAYKLMTLGCDSFYTNNSSHIIKELKREKKLNKHFYIKF